MAGTYVVLVPAGSTSIVQAVTPLTNVYLAPQTLGGTVTLYVGPSPVGPWTPWGNGLNSTTGASVRLGVNGYVYASAATSQAAMVITDMGGANSPQITQLAASNVTLASASSTAIQPLYSLRIPPGFLPLQFRCEIKGSVTVTNNANVKTLTCLMNGITGTSFLTSPSLASVAAYNFFAAFAGQGDGVSLKGFGVGQTGGFGTSTTAFTTLARDYINNETEIVIAATKATGTDTFQLDSLSIALY